MTNNIYIRKFPKNDYFRDDEYFVVKKHFFGESYLLHPRYGWAGQDRVDVLTKMTSLKGIFELAKLFQRHGYFQRPLKTTKWRYSPKSIYKHKKGYTTEMKLEEIEEKQSMYLI